MNRRIGDIQDAFEKEAMEGDGAFARAHRLETYASVYLAN